MDAYQEARVADIHSALNQLAMLWTEPGARVIPQPSCWPTYWPVALIGTTRPFTRPTQ